MAAVTDVVCYNVESVDRNTFCWTIITSTNVPIIIIMCQVNVFILLSYSERSCTCVLGYAHVCWGIYMCVGVSILPLFLLFFD
jgi:hypothetical protein